MPIEDHLRVCADELVNLREADKTGSGFCEHAKLPEPLTGLYAKLRLEPVATLDQGKVFTRVVIAFRLEREVVGEIERKSTAEARLRDRSRYPTAETEKARLCWLIDGKGGELNSDFEARSLVARVAATRLLGLRRARMAQAKAYAGAELKIVFDPGGKSNQQGLALRGVFIVRPIPNNRIAGIETHDHAVGGIQFQHTAKVAGKVRLPADARIGDGKAEDDQRGAGLVRENFADSEKARANFSEDAKLLKTLAGLHSKLHLERPAVSQVLKDSPVWKETGFSFDCDLSIEVVSYASAETQLSRVAEEVRTKEGERSNLRADFEFVRGGLSADTSPDKQDYCERQANKKWGFVSHDCHLVATQRARKAKADCSAVCSK